MILVVAFLVRIYWALIGNHHARSIFYAPVLSGAWWRGFGSQVAYYLFLKKESDLWVGHNPVAQAAMFFMFTLGTLFMIVTGLALYAEQWGWGTAWMTLVRVGVRRVRRSADGAHAAPPRDVVPAAVRVDPHRTWCSARTS